MKTVKNGYTAVPHQVLECISGAQLSATQLKVLLLLWRFTYGFHKQECILPVSYLAKMLNASKSHVGKSIRALEKSGVLRAKTPFHGGAKVYRFNENTQDWHCGFGCSETAATGLGEKPRPVGEKILSPCDKSNTNKDIWKDTFKDNKKWQQKKQTPRYDYEEIKRRTIQNLIKNSKGEMTE